MAKGHERTDSGVEEPDAPELSPAHERPVFEQPATLREPAAPRVPRVMPPSAVSVIRVADEEQAQTDEAQLVTLQDARQATDALLHDILEETPAGTSEPTSGEPRVQPSKEEDWPSELHALPLPVP
ncbi:hypothetical protein [Vitiosangium sp. GDMCC 1.1324]|uniref:hypothetical protein n=1 Tax=Vitiosangium sp. (strain GDMCC 1.1324) TaxID=2138576 RepID=UPI000D3D8B13|nr:hypothetical protein [Vitiosangium sp. GDMCC 1.1324]PTL76692.1 hypothetical protein DAT35_48040 [Vitiosangium sp. GDMCC 1.1324]